MMAGSAGTLKLGIFAESLKFQLSHLETNLLHMLARQDTVQNGNLFSRQGNRWPSLSELKRETGFNVERVCERMRTRGSISRHEGDMYRACAAMPTHRSSAALASLPAESSGRRHGELQGLARQRPDKS